MSLLWPNVRCSNCQEQLEILPDITLDCWTPGGCKIPAVPRKIDQAIALRQDLFRLKEMGFPEAYKKGYIDSEHAPDIHIMQLSMLADEIIAEYQQKVRASQNGQKNSRT